MKGVILNSGRRVNESTTVITSAYIALFFGDHLDPEVHILSYILRYRYVCV